MTQIFCLEGITGAGKTTQGRFISNYLNFRETPHLIVNEKSYEPFKQTVINWHLQGANLNFSKEDVLEMARARAEVHRLHLVPLLGKIEYMIFDRSFYTGGVYESDGEMTQEEIIQINLREGVLFPERGVILVCSPEIARRRIDERRAKSKYNLPSMHESLEEITKRKERYVELSKQHSELVLIDTSDRTEEDIFKEVKDSLRI